MGRDFRRQCPARSCQDFNPRAPSGARPSHERLPVIAVGFQSTRPVWGATGVRLPKEEKRNISIHAPRVGRDGARGRGEVQSVDISIHAPRVGRDRAHLWNGYNQRYFNPRAPCGARPLWRTPYAARGNFNPRAPCGARLACSSSHVVESQHFNPRAPCGARPRVSSHENDVVKISIHAPRVGRDKYIAVLETKHMTFQSTRPVWGATANLTILPRQICTKGTKEFLLGRKTHGKKEK